jgi:hypothetical protein
MPAMWVYFAFALPKHVPAALLLPGILHDAQGLNAPDFLAAGLAAFLAKGIIFWFIISTLRLG